MLYQKLLWCIKTGLSVRKLTDVHVRSTSAGTGHKQTYPASMNLTNLGVGEKPRLLRYLCTSWNSFWDTCVWNGQIYHFWSEWKPLSMHSSASRQITHLTWLGDKLVLQFLLDVLFSVTPSKQDIHWIINPVFLEKETVIILQVDPVIMSVIQKSKTEALYVGICHPGGKPLWQWRRAWRGLKNLLQILLLFIVLYSAFNYRSLHARFKMKRIFFGILNIIRRVFGRRPKEQELRIENGLLEAQKMI